jgi:hypothetical protein
MKWEKTENLPTPETDRIYFGGNSESKENIEAA